MFTLPCRAPLHPYGWNRPVGNTDYRITSPYGKRTILLDGQPYTDFHSGIDIGNGWPLGDAVLCIADGKVIAVGNLHEPWSTPSTRWASGNYGGLMIVVKHNDIYTSAYAHLSAEYVSVGETVKAGDKIGAQGDSGSAHGQGHLHLDLYENGKHVDPAGYLFGTVKPLVSKDNDMLRATNLRHVVNKRCTILAGTNVRTSPDLNDDSSIWTTDKDYSWIPDSQCDGTTEPVTKSNDWYGGWAYVPKYGWTYVFIHDSRVKDLATIETVNVSDANKDKVFEQIAELATKGKSL